MPQGREFPSFSSERQPPSGSLGQGILVKVAPAQGSERRKGSGEKWVCAVSPWHGHACAEEGAPRSAPPTRPVAMAPAASAAAARGRRPTGERVRRLAGKGRVADGRAWTGRARLPRRRRWEGWRAARRTSFPEGKGTAAPRGAAGSQGLTPKQVHPPTSSRAIIRCREKRKWRPEGGTQEKTDLPAACGEVGPDSAPGLPHPPPPCGGLLCCRNDALLKCHGV